MTALILTRRTLFFVLFGFMLLSLFSAYALDSAPNDSYSKADSGLLDELSRTHSALAFVTMKEGADALSLNVPLVKSYSFGVAAVKINESQL